MSTSALASARRRRATSENPVATNASASINNRGVQQVQQVQQVQKEQNQTLTPLQILQIHDIKIKELETLITEFTDEDLLTKFIDDKLESVVYSKNDNSTQRENITTDEKLQLQEKNVDQKIELQNTKIDDFKTLIRELIASIKEENTNIMKYVNTNIQNQITSNANLLNDKIAQKCEAMNNIETIISEFNELKLLVIKTQNMALETSNSVNKLYEQCNSNSARLKEVESSVSLLHSKKSDATSNIMLQSLFSGSLFKSGDFNAFDFNCQPGDNCEKCEPDEIYDENMGEIKKLNIDFDNNELVLSEEQIEDLLDVRIPTEDNISIHEIIDDASTSLTATSPQEDTSTSPQEDTAISPQEDTATSPQEDTEPSPREDTATSPQEDTATSPQEDTEPSPDPVPTPE